MKLRIVESASHNELQFLSGGLEEASVSLALGISCTEPEIDEPEISAAYGG